MRLMVLEPKAGKATLFDGREVVTVFDVDMATLTRTELEAARTANYPTIEPTASWPFLVQP